MCKLLLCLRRYFQPTTQPFIIGYATEGVIAEAIPYGQLTHINYAFLIPNADGTADALHPFENLANPWKLEKIVALAHAQGVQVLISVGGWGWDEQFEVLRRPTARPSSVGGPGNAV
jgi:GH18 family chitinase